MCSVHVSLCDRSVDVAFAAMRHSPKTYILWGIIVLETKFSNITCYFIVTFCMIGVYNLRLYPAVSRLYCTRVCTSIGISMRMCSKHSQFAVNAIYTSDRRLNTAGSWLGQR